MFMAINFDDGRKTYVKRVNDEGDVLREKKKFEKTYTIRQVANTKGGLIFLANKKLKYIWE